MHNCWPKKKGRRGLNLGATLALSYINAVYQGVLSGCHRWTLQHSITAATNIVSLVGMVAVLQAKQGLIALAMVYACANLLGQIIRLIYAYRVCPGLSVKWRLASKSIAKEMLGFGGKMYLGRVSSMVMNLQTITIAYSVYHRSKHKSPVTISNPPTTDQIMQSIPSSADAPSPASSRCEIRWSKTLRTSAKSKQTLELLSTSFTHGDRHRCLEGKTTLAGRNHLFLTPPTRT